MRTPHPTFGQKIAALRAERRLKQVEAATAIGISRSYLAGIEAGRDLPGREVLLAIANFYGADLNDLTNGLPAVLPGDGEFIEDPDELALVRFWRTLDKAERALLVRMMNPPPSQP